MLYGNFGLTQLATFLVLQEENVAENPRYQNIMRETEQRKKWRKERKFTKAVKKPVFSQKKKKKKSNTIFYEDMDTKSFIP